jgi:hypothetical protein
MDGNTEMTHDELLEELTQRLSRKPRTLYESYLKALRAVVELHKPRTDPASTCSGCALDVLYPCPTIQAIEKELE